MVLNPHFHNYGFSSEQNLLEDLVIEYVQQFGLEIYYIPRRRGNFDQLHYDDDQSYFDTAYPIEMYMTSFTGLGGETTFMSKFDVQVRDQVVFSIARRRFELEIGSKENFLAPREGDLIYFPMNNHIFQISFSDNKPFFYQLGTLQMFNITAERYEASSEVFRTGITAIDVFHTQTSRNVLDFVTYDRDGAVLLTRDGDYLLSREWHDHLDDSGVDDNDYINKHNTDDDIIQFTEENPYSNRNPY